jgi:hypothetical protein
MSTRPVELSPALAAAVERARAELAEDGELRGRSSGYQSPLDERTRDVVRRFLSDGTYRRLTDMVAADDPEIADL